MIVKLLTDHHLEYLNLKGGCRGSSESTLVKMSNCWKFHAAAHIIVASLPLIRIIINSWLDFNKTSWESSVLAC